MLSSRPGGEMRPVNRMPVCTLPRKTTFTSTTYGLIEAMRTNLKGAEVLCPPMR